MDNFEFLTSPPLNPSDFGTCNKAARKFDGVIGCLKKTRSLIDPKEKSYYEKEFYIMTQLNHMNIAKAYEKFWDEDQFCMFIEFASQGSLADFCGKPTPKEKIIQWTRQIVSGLSILHRNNIVHRDLKPANILVSSENILKITDYGIADEFLQSRLASMAKAGTLKYIAPELVLGGSASFSCDVFSLGVILYELASGKLPFSGKTVNDYVENIQKGPPPLPFSISAEFSNLIFKMIQRNPENRPTLSEILSHPLVQPENTSGGNFLAKKPSSEDSKQSFGNAKTILCSKPVSSQPPTVSTGNAKTISCSKSVASQPPTVSTGNAKTISCSKPTAFKSSSVSVRKAEANLLSEIFIGKSLSTPVATYKLSSFGNSNASLSGLNQSILNFEHWIFVSSDFDFSSFELSTDPNKTIFIIFEKSVDGIHQQPSYVKQNKVLKSVLIFHPLKTFGSKAFSSCSSLQSISFPNTLTSLGECCFSSCSSLQSISLPNTITSLGEFCFLSCSSLQSISLPNSLTSLGSGCFCHCTSLQSIKLPQNIKKIPDNCFGVCMNLSYIFIPKSIVSIHSMTFYECEKLLEDASGEKRIDIENGSNFTIEIIRKQCASTVEPGQNVVP